MRQAAVNFFKKKKTAAVNLQFVLKAIYWPGNVLTAVLTDKGSMGSKQASQTTGLQSTVPDWSDGRDQVG